MARTLRKPGPTPRGLNPAKNKTLRLQLVPGGNEQAEIPKSPKGLLASSRKRWASFWQSAVAKAVDTASDMHRIERWIRAVDEYERVGVVLRKQRVVRGSTGQLVMSPLAGYVKQLQDEIARAESELGMTPLSRMRLGIAYGQAQLTAAELNKALEGANEESERSDWEADWREA